MGPSFIINNTNSFEHICEIKYLTLQRNNIYLNYIVFILKILKYSLAKLFH